MKTELKNNFTFAVELPATSYAAGVHTTGVIDFSDAPSLIYLVEVGNINTAGTVNFKFQYSADGTTFTDEPSGLNDTAITQISTNGNAKLYVTSPRAEFGRGIMTVGTNAVTAVVISGKGPLRFVDEG